MVLLVSLRKTRRSGSSYGKGRSNTALTTLKMAVFAPIPSASASTTINVIPGFFNNIRAPYRTSCQSVCIFLLPDSRLPSVPHIRAWYLVLCVLFALYTFRVTSKACSIKETKHQDQSTKLVLIHISAPPTDRPWLPVAPECSR